MSTRPHTHAILLFVTPEGRIAEVPGSSGILPLPDTEPAPALMREARAHCRDRDVSRIEIYRNGRRIASGRV